MRWSGSLMTHQNLLLVVFDLLLQLGELPVLFEQPLLVQKAQLGQPARNAQVNGRRQVGKTWRDTQFKSH